MLKYLALLCYTTILGKAYIASDSNSSYNESIAYYLVDFVGISYCCGNLGHGVEDWSCDYCKKHPQVSYHKEFKSSLLDFTGTGGFLAYDNSTQKLILSVTGTDPLKLTNYIDDVVFYLKVWGRDDCHGCKIDAGFLRAYNSVKDDIMALFVDAHAWITTPITGIYVTGHSLGATIAMLAAVGLLDAGYEIELFYTFGEPRIGNSAAATFITSLLKTNHYRITHRDDPIPHLGPEILGYRHTTHEVWYPQSPTGYYFICDNSGEDPNCADSVLIEPNPLELPDHLDYMGFPFTTNYLGCKV